MTDPWLTRLYCNPDAALQRALLRRARVLQANGASNEAFMGSVALQADAAWRQAEEERTEKKDSTT